MNDYVHGYSPRETVRLTEQSFILEELLHADTNYPEGSTVLETGCGVGAQTQILARRNPKAHITSIDISPESLSKAKEAVNSEGLSNVAFENMDIMNLSFEQESFDHIFICFVLEHLPNPHQALVDMKRILKPGGTLTAIEGDHGSCFWYPETAASLKTWQCLIDSQQSLGHDPLIGRRLYPLLREAGFNVGGVAPKWVYTDANNPRLMDGVLNQIIVPMTKTAKDQSILQGLIDEKTFNQGIADLERTGTPPDGTFFYTWFKAMAVKPV
jgi:ubiquinone/menaquinone biosynthesis C-methylase UbiE